MLPSRETQLVAKRFVRSSGQRRICTLLISFEQTRKLSVQLLELRLPPLEISTFHGYLSPESFAHIRKPKPICFRLLIQAIALPFSLARARAGNSMLARIAIMAI